MSPRAVPGSVMLTMGRWGLPLGRDGRQLAVLVLTRMVRRVSPPEDVCVVLLGDGTLHEMRGSDLDVALWSRRRRMSPVV